ncbi:ATP-dependent helicase HrpB [Phragmitibacter flavus]|uniref:ATP-dependent helicase HrpB n=1 Tax=Phragmitibacter flavus TaxID=2576071 RepID=UPI0014085132|nr:ATP-dependent helicase HrpB [Phragmitibacter flavus]
MSLLPIEALRGPITHWFDPTTPGIRNAVVRSPTGSGKSTQVPQMLLALQADSSPAKQIIVLQPRRIAARMLAARVAKELNTKLGDLVGYQVRFENVSSANTRILFVTEGVMLRHLLGDPQLSKVSHLVIDEFHERHLDGDLCLAWAKAIQQNHRPDLRIVVMSATIAPGPLRDFLEPCEIFDSPGRTFPVDIAYQAPLRDKASNLEPVWDQAARAAETLITKQNIDGDLLIFMPGGHEIRKTITALSGRAFTKGIRILPLHGELPPAQQDEVLQPGGSRRIIVSTNVAETSLTIEGVRAVIDAGLARVASYDQRRGLNTLTVQKISRASADQRSGRAGRLGPGYTIRLWPQSDHAHRAENDPPEIHRLDLSEALLTLATVSNKANLPFTWFEPPTPESQTRAQTLLQTLGAFEIRDLKSQITAIGSKMATFPLHPRFSRMLLTAVDLQCLHDAALCAAIAQGRDLLLKPHSPQVERKQEEFLNRHDLSEFQPLMRAFYKAQSLNFDPQACSQYAIHARAAQETARTFQQLLRLLPRANPDTENDNPEALAQCLLTAFSDHLGIETGSGSRVYNLAAGYKGHLEKSAHLKPPPLLVAAEIAEIQGKALQVKLNLTTRIEEGWLRDLFPDDLATTHSVAFDPVNKRVTNREETRFRDLTLQSRERGEPDPGLAASLLADEILANRIDLPTWTEKHEQYITRLNNLAAWMPELELPPIGPDDRRLLIEQMCLGCTAVRQIKERTPDSALRSWLSASQRDLLERYAPEQIKLANGRTVSIEYRDNASPQISVILQHLYDTHETPRIAGGKIPLTVNILAPNRRPAQTTNDLASFWKNSYQLVKTQLKGRYPKHEWR